MPSGSTASTVTDDAEIAQDLREGVLWLTIDRPQAGNALTPANRTVLIDAFAAADRDPGIRAVVLTADGRSGVSVRAPICGSHSPCHHAQTELLTGSPATSPGESGSAPSA